MDGTISLVSNVLDQKRRVSKRGIEYWLGRDIQLVLGYDQWRNFLNVIEKAKSACAGSGFDVRNHFAEVSKTDGSVSAGMRKREDYYLTRYACYLIAMNGDAGKPQIAAAQTYFAIQTRKQEIREQANPIEQRLELRQRVLDANKELGKAAQDAGVVNFGLFHDAGYRGLYDMGLSAIKTKKGLEPKESLMDRAGRAELAANEFRITQAEEKLIRDRVKGEQNAIETHKNVGQEVRKTIKKLGGTMPEDLPAEPSIKKLAQKKAKELKSGQE